MTKAKHDRVFPKVLHRLLATRSREDVVSWNEPHGKSFKIHNRSEFLKVLATHGIKQSQYKSFVRQLNLWGFRCIHGCKKNVERGSYYHEYFLRDDPSKLEHMTRIKVKRSSKKKAVVAHHPQDEETSSPAMIDKDENDRKAVASPPQQQDDEHILPMHHVVYSNKESCCDFVAHPQRLESIEDEDEKTTPSSFPSLDDDDKKDDFSDINHMNNMNNAFDFGFFEYLDARPWATDEEEDRMLLEDCTTTMDAGTLQWLNAGRSMTDAEYARLMGA